MEAGITSYQESMAGRLARIFPGATAMGIPVSLEHDGRKERTTIEFGTGQEFIFRADSALSFDECVRLRNHNGSLDVLVKIIAMQWVDSKQVVAGRLTSVKGQP